MKSILAKTVPCVAILLLSASCTYDTDEDTTAESQESPYIANAYTNYCLLTKTHAPSIKMCVQGNGDLTRARRLTEESLLQWLNALRPVTSNVTSTIEFTCNSPDGYVTVSNSVQRAYAMGSNVWVGNTSEPGTYLHEFGHSFACLGDTYASYAGVCLPGQPRSIMCDGLLRNTLAADDIAGVRAQYARHFGRSVPGASSTMSTPNDADSDGIPNHLDRCPNTPPGSHVWNNEYQGYWRGCAPGQIPTRN